MHYMMNSQTENNDGQTKSNFYFDSNSIPVTSIFNERNNEGDNKFYKKNEDLKLNLNRGEISDEMSKIKEKVLEQEKYISYLKSLLYKNKNDIEDAR